MKTKWREEKSERKKKNEEGKKERKQETKADKTFQACGFNNTRGFFVSHSALPLCGRGTRIATATTRNT